MAIAFVNAASKATASAVTTITTTYAPTAGNIVIGAIAFSGAPGTISMSDSASNALTAGPTVSTLFGFFYTASAGVTNFVANWTNSVNANMAIQEYSGVVGGVNASLSGNTSSGTSTTPSISPSTQDSNDWIVAQAGSAQLTTITTGTQRVQVGTGSAKLTSGDNTAASAGPVTVAGTLAASVAWGMIAMELRSTAGGGGSSSASWLSKSLAAGMNKHG